jgi:hypothetical protein
MTAYAIEVRPEDIGDILVQGHERDYITETSTGLLFREHTPIEVWAAFVTRLLRQHKSIEWAIADAINFGERRYGEMYSQWVEQTHLAKKTLANIAWVGRKVESSRRREDVDFSYHAEVAALEPKEQDRLLDTAVNRGMSRYELREAIRERRKELEGRAATTDGTPIPDGPDLWCPDISDLTDEARAALEAHAPGGRHRQGYVAGWLRALLYTESRDCFLPGRWRD